MEFRNLFLIVLACALCSCELADGSGEDAESSMAGGVLFAPFLEMDSGAILPEVDSVRISIFLVRRSKDSLYCRRSAAWASHGDTFPALPQGESLLVRVEGIRLQSDSSVAVWWSGSARGAFARSPDGGVRSLSIHVSLGDTVGPTLVSRKGDTVGHDSSSIRLWWRLGEGCGCVATIDDSVGIAVRGDSVAWEARWPSGGRRVVVASFRDKAGNVLVDTVVVVRRERVAAPTFAIDEGEDGFPVVRISSATSGAGIEYSLDSGKVWRKYGDSIVLTSTTALHARASRSGMDTSVVAATSQAVVVPAPSFSVPSGTGWNDFLAVKLATRIVGASLQYSLDGTSWNLYRDSIVLGASATVRARAVRNWELVGAVDSAVYEVEVARPTFSVNDGARSEDLLAVRLECATPDARFEYSLDSGRSWTSYRDSIVLGKSIRLKARASKPGMGFSEVSMASYDISLPPPEFSVASGAFSDDLLGVALSCRTPGASIEYSTNGVNWASGDSVVLGASANLWARAKKDGMETGPVAKSVYWVQIAKPVFGGATSSADLLRIGLSCATPGARIEYSLDSAATWRAYRDSIVLGRSITMYARSSKPGMATSALVQAGFAVSLPAPSFSIPSETRWNDLLAVKLSCPVEGATIQYSFDGLSWTAYEDSIVVGRDATLMARSVKTGMDPSPVATAVYRVQAESPSFSVNSGARADDLLAVRLASTTPGADLEYSLDSGATWRPYADSVVLGHPIVLVARACKKDLACSAPSYASYEISLPAPVFSVPSETFWNDVLAVGISCSVPGASLQYSTDEISWRSVRDTVQLGSSAMLWARAVKPGMLPGAVATAKYWVQAASPTFSVSSGTSVDHPLAVRMRTATPDASIEYSLDSGRSWIAYADSVVLRSTVLLMARATKPGLATSPTTSASYGVAVATPTFSLPSHTYWNPGVALEIRCATPGATIQYSQDSVLWRNYDTPLVLTWSMWVWARGVKDGVQTSPVARALYMIQSSSMSAPEGGAAMADATATARRLLRRQGSASTFRERGRPESARKNATSRTSSLPSAIPSWGVSTTSAKASPGLYVWLVESESVTRSVPTMT